MSATPNLFARARESAAVLARAETLLRPQAGSDKHLREYWVHGEGAVKIGWGTPGDFDRCVRQLDEHVTDPQGLCAEYHHEATGSWPGEHGKKGAAAGVLESPLFFARTVQSRQRLAKYDPDQLRDDEGKWADGPGLGVDKLKLASRIQLGEGEKLLSSRKFKSSGSSSWHLMAAEVDTPNGRQVRLGVIHPDDSRRWSGGPDPTRDARVREIDAEIERLKEAEGNVDEIDQLSDERSELAGEADEAGLNRTAVIPPSAIAQLRDAIAEGEKSARRRSKEVDDFWAQHGDLWDEREKFNNTPWGQLSEADMTRFADLNDIFEAAPDWEVVHAEGVIPAGGDGDLVFSVDGNDRGVGEDSWEVKLGVRPPDADEDWYPGFSDDAALFEPKDIKALLAGLGELVVGSPSAPTNRARLPRAEFSESKHKRDRKGRFAKSAAAVVSELDELMAKLSALTEDLGGDEDDSYDVEQALDALKAVRERRHVRANRRDVTLETENGEVSVLIDGDGDISLDFDNGSFFMPPAEAKQLAGVLDGFRATPLPENTSITDPVELARVPFGDDGELAAVLWDRGLVEVGPAANVGGEDLGGDVLLLEDFDEVAEFTDVLEELADRSLAETASQGPATNTAATLPYNHPGHPDQKSHGRKRKRLPDPPEVEKPAESQPEKSPEKKPDRRKAAPKPKRGRDVDYSAEPWKAPGAVGELAGAFHDQWRETRRQDDGSYEPRIKTTKDKAWAAEHGTDQVDIANTEYADLPDDWQAENKAAAETVIELLEWSQGTPLDTDDKRNEAGNWIHDAWLGRNEWARGGELDVPFEELPKVEQDKDIAQYETALKVFRKSKNPDKEHRSMKGDAR